MRKSFVAAVAIAVAITAATPAAAAPRDRDRTEQPSIVKYIQAKFNKVFKVKGTSAPIIPIPGPDNGGKP